MKRRFKKTSSISNKKLLLMFLSTVFFLSCSSLSIQKKVSKKLLSDKQSFEIYNDLCVELNQNGNDTSFDFYLVQYNKGFPLFRIFEYKTLIESISSKTCDEHILKEDFTRLLVLDDKYIKDQRRDYYFKTFLRDYFIIPPSQ